MKHQFREIFGFTIEHRQFAIPLTTVDQVLMAVAVTPVPDLSPFIYGLMDYHGTVVPVINLRNRLALPEQPVRVSDVFILAETSRRKIALVADEATGVIFSESRDLAETTLLDPGLEVAGILRRDDGIMVIFDVERLLTSDVEVKLDAAIDQHIATDRNL